jgi:hypothetical protein
MILLWGLPAEGPIALVYEALMQFGAGVAFLDQRAVLETNVELSVAGSVDGLLEVGPDTISLSDVTAVYLRPYDTSRLPAIQEAGQGSPQWAHALSVNDILLSWLELTEALVINRPSAMASNSSKPYQAAIIRDHGFAVPATLITTDPQAVLEFWEKHGTVIYKSVSGVRSVVSRLKPMHLDYLADVNSCPTQFQEYIPGSDYRAHVVGDDVFACEIVSSADDYRYLSGPGDSVEIRAYDLPGDCETLCRELAASMELPVAGIDLRRTPEGVWYCFEVNPSPGYSAFQEPTGQPIDRAIARLLMSASKATRRV